MVVEGWLSRAAAARPQRAALQTPAATLSYAELYAAARAGAQELAGAGAGAGTRVAIALPPGAAFVQALHACLLLGAVAVPVDLRLLAAERERVEAGAALTVAEPLAARAPAAEAPRGERHELDATAIVVHTSGSTGTPRAVELSYGNLLWSALGSAVALGLDEQERWLCTLPLSHVGGISIVLRSAIYATTAVVHERFETGRALAALREQQITLVSLVPTTLARLLDAGLREPPSLRCALTGGGPAPRGLLGRARAAGVPVRLTYGLTEAASQATTEPLAAAGAADAEAQAPQHAAEANAGVPLFCTRVQIAGDGEILLSGPTIARAALAPDGWLHTGDLGRLDAGGRLLVTGRKADTIVSGGENVAPAEVEGAIEAHPDVLEAAVFGRADPEWGEAVTAIVLARAGARLDAEELRAHCARLLAPYKVPKRFEAAAAPLPRTPSGKLLRRELR